MSKKECIEAMSPYLFWDVDRTTLDLDTHRSYIVQRVLEYGLMQDWVCLKHTLGIPAITATCKGLRSLEPRALAFISLVSKTPREEFRCYTTKQSSREPWNS